MGGNPVQPVEMDVEHTKWSGGYDIQTTKRIHVIEHNSFEAAGKESVFLEITLQSPLVYCRHIYRERELEGVGKYIHPYSYHVPWVCHGLG